MAHKVIWSPSALHDLQHISDYIANGSVANANSVIAKILEAIETLEAFPRIGRKVPESDRDELREILVFNWRIIYEISDYDVDILEIVHGAQRSRG